MQLGSPDVTTAGNWLLGFGKTINGAGMAVVQTISDVVDLWTWHPSNPVPHRHRYELAARVPPSLVMQLVAVVRATGSSHIPHISARPTQAGSSVQAQLPRGSCREPLVPCVPVAPRPLLWGYSQSPGGAWPRQGPFSPPALLPQDWVAPVERRHPWQCEPLAWRLGATAAPSGSTVSSKAPRCGGAFCLTRAKPLSPLLLLSIFFPAFLIKEDYRFPSLSPGFILKRLNDMLTP